MASSKTHPHTDMPSEDELARLILDKHPKHHELYLETHRLILGVAPDVCFSVDLVDGVIEGHADAVLAASIFHFGEYTIREAKIFMASRGVEVRL